jgi:ribosomal protein S18 acetylase RimI-like enzyme
MNRDNEAALLDEISINATASAVMQLLDGWLLRAAPDLPFNRCNCAIALSDAPGGAIEEVEAFFSRHRIPARVQVRDSMTALDNTLTERGYVVESQTDVLVAATAAVVARSPNNHDVRLHEELDDEAIEMYGDVMGETAYIADRIKAYGRMTRSLGPVAFAATVSNVGIGFGIVERGWIGYYGIGTASHARRQGVGTAIMRALTERAIEHGATNAYLQVDHANEAAQQMYAGLGFTRWYGYHYRVRP